MYTWALARGTMNVGLEGEVDVHRKRSEDDDCKDVMHDSGMAMILVKCKHDWIGLEI